MGWPPLLYIDTYHYFIIQVFRKHVMSLTLQKKIVYLRPF